ncbi:M18 family aminopeptidase [Muribaculaceae bacterium Isolate-113 (HZI)]|nr:M18 family aminopeptidase [Muribaculaceae bacterium Isolate-114 (HZI)]ROT23880.1 M18 family aminopeptidase [Muribaculaceae bacterium Isolate-113 (HZI)]GFI39832.1 putative M18 family aminopeptidase 2 [Muribaculaceae bacterium]GFI57086.1 putative M18 family aminopeptidase 2 [Muribaculaceae bacterium]
MIKRLLNWLDESTCNFMAVAAMERELLAAGFSEIRQENRWDIKRGGKYYLKKNDSAIFAFIVGEGDISKEGFRIVSAHSDSPCFKIKPNAEIYGDGGVVSLNVEKYGGGILYTWFDRPLSISGRVMVKGKDALHPHTLLVDLKRPVATIPHLAIHFNRSVNEGNALSVQKDMKPVLGYYSQEEIETFKREGGVVKSIVAAHLGISARDIIKYELCLYPAEKAALTGISGEYFQSARIDDLSMAFAGLEALLRAPEKSDATRVLAVFDNEETGSGTKQGAASPVLRDAMDRIVRIIEGDDPQNTYMAVANSFMISADDAHAWHPNYNEKYDPTNHPVIGGGPVIKINANCKYMTDAQGAAVFSELCDRAGVRCQYFVNHADVAGGSTLGNISSSQFDIRGVDMGNAIWAMHSARETAGVTDHIDTVKVFNLFYQ